MATYKVLWEIEVEADTLHQAAFKAQTIQRDPESTATVFLVVTPEGTAYRVDTYDDVHDMDLDGVDVPEAEGDIAGFMGKLDKPWTERPATEFVHHLAQTYGPDAVRRVLNEAFTDGFCAGIRPDRGFEIDEWNASHTCAQLSEHYDTARDVPPTTPDNAEWTPW